MASRSEAHQRRRRAIENESIGMLINGFVAAGGGQYYEDRIARLQRDALDVDTLSRKAAGVMDGGIEACHFANECVDQAGCGM